MRTFLITLSVLAVLILGYHFSNLRRENIQLQSRVGRMETQVADRDRETLKQNNERLQAQVNTERQRLDQLKSSLAQAMEVTVQPPTGSVEAHISDITRRISTLEAQLTSLGQQSRATRVNAQTFRQDSQNQTLSQRADLEARLRSLDEQIAAVPAGRPAGNPAGYATGYPPGVPAITSPPAPTVVPNPDMANLVRSRNEIMSQLQQLSAADQQQSLATDQQAASDQADIEEEKLNLQSQLGDMRGDLNFWRSVNSGRAPAAQPARVTELQNQIRSQEARLNKLDAQIRAR